MGGESDAAHHAQWVIAECHVGVKRCGDDSILQVEQSIEAIYQLAVACAVEANGQCIDGEVASVEVVIQCAVLDDGLAAASGVAFASRPYELHLLSLVLELCRAKVAEHADVCSASQPCSQLLGHTYAGAYHQAIDVLGRPLQVEVSHISAYHIAFHAQTVGRLAYLVEDGSVEQLCQVGVGQVSHAISFLFVVL